MNGVDVLDELMAVIRKVNRIWGTKISLKQKNADLSELRLVENGKTLVKGSVEKIDYYVAGMLLLTELKGDKR